MAGARALKQKRISATLLLGGGAKRIRKLPLLERKLKSAAIARELGRESAAKKCAIGAVRLMIDEGSFWFCVPSRKMRKVVDEFGLRRDFRLERLMLGAIQKAFEKDHAFRHVIVQDLFGTYGLDIDMVGAAVGAGSRPFSIRKS